MDSALCAGGLAHKHKRGICRLDAELLDTHLGPETYRDRARSSSRPAWYGKPDGCSTTDGVIAGENGAYRGDLPLFLLPVAA
jgi:hypothetical protein